MVNAFLFGTAAQSTLILGGLMVYWFKIPSKFVGWLAGYGAGAFISAIAYNLVAQASALGAEILLWIILGAAVFVFLDRRVEIRFGEKAGAMGIVLGSIIDGVPESIIFGVQLATGGAISSALLAAVMVSNLPQAIAPSADLKVQGQSIGRTARMWIGVVVICGLTAGITWLLATYFPALTGDRASAFAAGGLIAMLMDSLIPFGYERGGLLTGFWGALGFAVSVLQQ